MQIQFKDRLSFKLMLICVSLAFLLGVFLSLAQMVFDYYGEKQAMQAEGPRLLNMMRQPAAEAAYNYDPGLAQRVMDGLAKNPGVFRAELKAYPDEVLAKLSRAKTQDELRGITDRLFGQQNSFVIPLRSPVDEQPVGELTVYLDTFHQGRAFLSRAAVVIAVGMLRSVFLSMILLAIFYIFLTRPISLISEALSKVNPHSPERTRLPEIKGHEGDEIGGWIGATNQLLDAIDQHLSKRQEAEERAAYLRQFDRLTDLPNRNLFYDRLTQAMEYARREGHRVAVMYMDVRDFQSINDQHGFGFGDQVLRNIVQRLAPILPEQATMARISGDRFAIAYGELSRPDMAASLAQSLIEVVSHPIVIADKQINIAICLGIAMYPDDAFKIDPLVQAAEKSLAVAKGLGHNIYQFYLAEMGERIRRRKQLEQELQEALDNDRLKLVFHPQFDCDTGHICGAEALTRWEHPERGPISPDEFIPLAEQCGLIEPLGEWTLYAACEQVAKWRAKGLNDLIMAVNVSAAQFETSDLHESVIHHLSEANVPAHALEVEITETAMMDNIDQAIDMLVKLREIGVHVAIDDFGTGQSSLNYLRRLPINKLKIDKSFIHELLSDKGGAMIVRAIISLGHSLDMKVIAEGVEAPGELSFLRDLGCDQIQGFYLAKPLSADEFLSLALNANPLPAEKQELFVQATAS